MYDVGGIKSMHVDSLACVTVEGDESERLRKDSGGRQSCIMSPWLFNVKYGCIYERGKDGDGK